MTSLFFSIPDIMEPLFQSLILYWSMENVTQTANLTRNGTNRTDLIDSNTNVVSQPVKSSEGKLHFGIINESCIINLRHATCPGGITMSFWLRLFKTRPTEPVKILGFGQPHENKNGFLVMEREDDLVIRMITYKYRCEIELDVVDGAWTHITFSFRIPRLLKGYRNGEQNVSNNVCVEVPNAIEFDQPLTSGAAKATLDEVMIWFHQLQRDEIFGLVVNNIGTNDC